MGVGGNDGAVGGGKVLFPKAAADEFCYFKFGGTLGQVGADAGEGLVYDATEGVSGAAMAIQLLG